MKTMQVKKSRTGQDMKEISQEKYLELTNMQLSGRVLERGGDERTDKFYIADGATCVRSVEKNEMYYMRAVREDVKWRSAKKRMLKTAKDPWARDRMKRNIRHMGSLIKRDMDNLEKTKDELKCLRKLQAEYDKL